MKNQLLSINWGTIDTPEPLNAYSPVESGGLGELITILLQGLIVIAGIYALFNFVLAGYAFISAGGDPKKIADAWGKIWQSVLGLTIAAGAFVLGGIFGGLIFGDFTFILHPRIPTP